MKSNYSNQEREKFISELIYHKIHTVDQQATLVTGRTEWLESWCTYLEQTPFNGCNKNRPSKQDETYTYKRYL